jgi:hypothetical protein
VPMHGIGTVLTGTAWVNICSCGTHVKPHRKVHTHGLRRSISGSGELCPLFPSELQLCPLQFSVLSVFVAEILYQAKLGLWGSYPLSQCSGKPVGPRDGIFRDFRSLKHPKFRE